ncbi:restriction endonuclease subunit S [Lactococcus hircilactis]|uniref:Restriction endonuclease subunit S n=2 Tax=Lactococcus hircilactis TaxID=1494462 RepID=A0A7X1Z9G1_9LACT|nr:restriction endonuclease subunit S [Lactococcus hircilactis]
MMSKKSPQLRFEGFTDDWEERKLIDIAGNISDGDWIEANHIFDTGDYRIVQTGNIGIGSFLDKLQNAKYFYQADFDELKANEIFPGDILISRLSDPAGRTSILPDLGVRAVTAVDVAIIRPNDNFHAEFLVAELNSSTILAKVDSLASGSTRKRISRKNLEGVQINLPTFEEQQKIGSFFKQLDDTIALHQRKLDLLKEQKKGYLQKMFPKNGAKVPELRFAGFADDWEERKLAEFTTSFSGGTPSAGNSSYYKGDIPFIRSGEINSDKTELFLTEDGLKNSSAKMVSVGDILYALYGAISGEVGISQINGAINQAILAIRPIGGYSSHFIMQWLRLQKQKIIDKYLQGGQGNLSGSIVKNLILNVPNFEEQQRIGSFFKQLDDTIALHQRKLDLLKEQKKGFLQTMFAK